MSIRAFPITLLALLISLIVSDVISIILLFHKQPYILALGLHGIVSVVGTLLLTWKGASNTNIEKPYLVYGFLLQFIFVLPVIGLIGAFIFSRHELFINQKDKHDEAVDALLTSSNTATQELPLETDKKYRHLLRYQDPESYLQLILSTQQMDEKNAIRILKIALNTDIENVRLLAQARLDSKENHINQALERHIQLVKQTQHQKNAHLHLEIARQYWSLADLGLAKDAVLDHVLLQLQKYTQIVTSLVPTEPVAYYLSAKGFLLAKDYQAAKKQLQLALKAGMPKNRITPMLKEVIFYEHLLKEMPLGACRAT